MQSRDANAPLALWGGIECTVNRVGDAWLSQIDRDPGLLSREHIERIAALGIRTLRFPILWERTCPDGGEPDWTWADARMGWLREAGITPIVGLVHHGSGPRGTSLVDPAFPAKLAKFAHAVASRYPWVTQWTPINEPLTTARFSGLYGAWYPHGRDERTFKTALLGQCRAIVEAMRAIERVVPGARLVQTDDLGSTESTPRMAYQARFQDQMRWLAWDLLFGRVDREHAMWGWLTNMCGASEAELFWHRDNPRPPDLIGINHYVTSNRWLDERLDRYAESLHGGNHRDRYADVDAVRVPEANGHDIVPLLQAAWARYRTPVAITEAHIDAPREDQLRWLMHIWTGAHAARAAGADIRAVTAWALFGAWDWNCLVTEARGYYESGAFDVRGGRLRPTAVARLVEALAHDGQPHAHPVLQGLGWWGRPTRFLHCEPVPGNDDAFESLLPSEPHPLLITGGNGTLGSAFARVCAERHIPYRLLCRRDMDIADADAVRRVLAAVQPWAVINAAGYVRVDDAEHDAERCFRENTLGAEILAAQCARHACGLLTFSSDLVFDGEKRSPYDEGDATAPLNVYGRSKAAAESSVLAKHPGALVVRTSAFFGPWDRYNFVSTALRTLGDGGCVEAASDVFVSPTYVPDLVNACLDLLIDGESGLCHLTNGESVSWAELAARAAAFTRIKATRLIPRPASDLGARAPRPVYSALQTTRDFAMPTLDDALARYAGSMASTFTLAVDDALLSRPAQR